MRLPAKDLPKTGDDNSAVTVLMYLYNGQYCHSYMNKDKHTKSCIFNEFRLLVTILE